MILAVLSTAKSNPNGQNKPKGAGIVFRIVILAQYVCSKFVRNHKVTLKPCN